MVLAGCIGAAMRPFCRYQIYPGWLVHHGTQSSFHHRACAHNLRRVIEYSSATVATVLLVQYCTWKTTKRNTPIYSFRSPFFNVTDSGQIEPH